MDVGPNLSVGLFKLNFTDIHGKLRFIAEHLVPRLWAVMGDGRFFDVHPANWGDGSNLTSRSFKWLGSTSTTQLETGFVVSVSSGTPMNLA